MFAQVRADLAERHQRKIDLSQRIHVVDVGGGIGSSTRSEIDCAQRRGITVTSMEP